MAGFLITLIILGVILVPIGLYAARVANERRSRDTSAATALSDKLRAFELGLPSEIIAAKYGVETHEKLRLGEVARHFDTNTSAAIDGWIGQEFGMHGWGVRLGGVGIGRVGLSGTSEVSLRSSGTNRDDLMGDGFVAVFEKQTDKGMDTLRVVVPSENATKEWIQAWLHESLKRFQQTKRDGKVLVSYPQSQTALRVIVSELSAFKNEASYISDRLHSVLRMPPETRPLITVHGARMSDHAIVGSAIQLGAEETLLPLFPVALIKTLSQAVVQASAICWQGQLAALSSDTAKPSESNGSVQGFGVTLLGVGTNKIAVIKAVRGITGLGVSESMHLVDVIPVPILQNVSQQTAELARRELEAAGAYVQVQHMSDQRDQGPPNHYFGPWT